MISESGLQWNVEQLYHQLAPRLPNLSVEVVKRNASKGGGVWQGPQLPLFPVLPAFQVLPKRWVVERTNAWTDRPRRLAKDQDLLPAVAEAWVWFVHASLLMRRIAAA